jgi:hypothetical protein
MIHNTRLAMSSVGTQQDYQLVQDLMQEDWWLQQLIARNLSAIWRRNWFPHNYEVELVSHPLPASQPLCCF